MASRRVLFVTFSLLSLFAATALSDIDTDPTHSNSHNNVPVPSVASNTNFPSANTQEASASGIGDIFNLLDPSAEAVLAYQAQQIYQGFWMDVQGGYASAGTGNCDLNQLTQRFTEIVDQYTTSDVHLSFPLGGIDCRGKPALVQALVGQYLGGNAGEHQITSFPLTKMLSNDKIVLYMNDVAYARRSDLSGNVLLGRKTFTFVRTRDILLRSRVRISELILEVRSTVPQDGGLPSWTLLSNPVPEA